MLARRRRAEMRLQRDVAEILQRQNAEDPAPDRGSPAPAAASTGRAPRHAGTAAPPRSNVSACSASTIDCPPRVSTRKYFRSDASPVSDSTLRFARQTASCEVGLDLLGQRRRSSCSWLSALASPRDRRQSQASVAAGSITCPSAVKSSGIETPLVTTQRVSRARDPTCTSSHSTVDRSVASRRHGGARPPQGRGRRTRRPARDRRRDSRTVVPMSRNVVSARNTRTAPGRCRDELADRCR